MEGSWGVGEGGRRRVVTYGPWASLGAPALRSPRNSLRLIERPLRFHAGEERLEGKSATRLDSAVWPWQGDIGAGVVSNSGRQGANSVVGWQ